MRAAQQSHYPNLLKVYLRQPHDKRTLIAEAVRRGVSISQLADDVLHAWLLEQRPVQFRPGVRRPPIEAEQD